MASRIIDIQKKSNQYMSNFDDNVISIITNNEQKTTEFNRRQMLNSKNAAGTDLIHNRTGSNKLSKAYAKITGKKKPNIFESGNYQKSMFLTMYDIKSYQITSDDEKVKYLPDNYDNLHGISPENQDKVRKINDKAICDDYMKKVFR